MRAADLEHPDELRVDLDPGPDTAWEAVRRVAPLVRDVLAEHGLRGWPKTSRSRGMHVNVRIERRRIFDQVRRAALALAREVERSAPAEATSRWWKEERHGVFLDYNQNAKDRTVASAWSVRPTPEARVSMRLAWEEVEDCDPAADRRRLRRLWTRPIRRVYEVDPVLCQECGGSMRILVFILNWGAVRKILTHFSSAASSSSTGRVLRTWVGSSQARRACSTP